MCWTRHRRRGAPLRHVILAIVLAAAAAAIVATEAPTGSNCDPKTAFWLAPLQVIAVKT